MISYPGIKENFIPYVRNQTYINEIHQFFNSFSLIRQINKNVLSLELKKIYLKK
jgi:hypothetical protein